MRPFGAPFPPARRVLRRTPAKCSPVVFPVPFPFPPRIRNFSGDVLKTFCIHPVFRIVANSSQTLEVASGAGSSVYPCQLSHSPPFWCLINPFPIMVIHTTNPAMIVFPTSPPWVFKDTPLPFCSFPFVCLFDTVSPASIPRYGRCK